MRVAVNEPGDQRAAAGVDGELSLRVGLERRDRPIANGERARLERLPLDLRTTEVLEAILRRSQDLGGALDRDRTGAQRAAGSGSSIGILISCSRAASSARG